MLFRRTKKLFYSALTLALLVSISACKNNISEDPKTAVKESVGRILVADSFDFETTLSAQYSDLPETGAQYNPQNELNKIFLEGSNLKILGNYDKKASKLIGEAQYKTKSNNIDLLVNVPYLVNYKNSEMIFGLYDFNTFFSLEGTKITSQQAIRIRLGKAETAAKRFEDSKNQLKQIFDTIEPSKFSKVALTAEDKNQKGVEKVRLSFTPEELQALLKEQKDFSSFRLQNDSFEKLNIDFIIGKNGQLVSVVYEMFNIKTGQYPIPLKSIKLETKFHDKGSLNLAFDLKEEDVVDYKNPAIDLLMSENYQAKQNVTRVYGEMSAVKTAIEAALFEGRKPVLSKEEQIEGEQEWVGWMGSNFVESMTIHQNEENAAQVDLIATLARSVDKDLAGSHMILSRSVNGVWSCILEVKDTSKMALAESVIPKACDLKPMAIAQTN